MKTYKIYALVKSYSQYQVDEQGRATLWENDYNDSITETECIECYEIYETEEMDYIGDYKTFKEAKQAVEQLTKEQ